MLSFSARTIDYNLENKIGADTALICGFKGPLQGFKGQIAHFAIEKSSEI